jgi:hypothetical protein
MHASLSRTSCYLHRGNRTADTPRVPMPVLITVHSRFSQALALHTSSRNSLEGRDSRAASLQRYSLIGVDLSPTNTPAASDQAPPAASLRTTNPA